QKMSILDGIPKVEIVEELKKRGVQVNKDQNKDVVLKQLEDIFAGVQHLPALLFESGKTSLEKVGLESYEVLACDPLHTFKGLTTNLYQEIPRHLQGEEKNLFKDSARASFHGKEAKNGGDYRRSLVDLTIYLDGEMTDAYVKLMRQLAELQEIAYSGEEKRTAKSILRFHNVSFLHADLMIELFEKQKSMSRRKLFGQYNHSLTSHAPIQYRILDLVSANTEQEEAAFNFMKEVSKHASNHHPDNILLTCFLRIQIREDWQRHLGILKKETRNAISKHGDLLTSERSNTFVPFKLMRLKPRKWQSQLERICDYLLIDGIWEEIQNGIIFHDLDETINYPPPHHFRSYTISQER
uniref:Uncharacterized protein n=2 Tax=Clytia hemisphaerica TaxID=252671 RepID=A0A7M5VER0_9CNID